MLATATALAVLLASDAFEFSWRYQLPALVLLPPAGVLGIAATAARVRFKLLAGQGVQSSQEPAAPGVPRTASAGERP